MSRDNLVTGLVGAVPLLLFAAYWSYRRSTVARIGEPSGSAGPIPLWTVPAVLGLLALVVLLLVDAHVARGLLVALVPFAILFGFWAFMRGRTLRPPPAAPENPSARPVVTQRSRRMALLPIVIVLGIFTIVRAVIEH